MSLPSTGMTTHTPRPQADQIDTETDDSVGLELDSQPTGDWSDTDDFPSECWGKVDVENIPHLATDCATEAELRARFGPPKRSTTSRRPERTAKATPATIPGQTNWVSAAVAAARLGEPSETALVKKLQRYAKPGADGAVTAKINGVVGRKFGKHWKVAMSSEWMGVTATASGTGGRR